MSAPPPVQGQSGAAELRLSEILIGPRCVMCNLLFRRFLQISCSPSPILDAITNESALAAVWPDANSKYRTAFIASISTPIRLATQAPGVPLGDSEEWSFAEATGERVSCAPFSKSPDGANQQG
jgi:hypothetical protein